eukprot:TRINITY_DN768_c0_g1_i1.p1 TRINITY_DN768_c0_g1~~TRINITY_DN768_c0_g1_i1.p1  ORF type:complete len:286 (-),score=34.22 TRINITY_DN768_c0_g1_i1:107-964(-)
MCIRDRVSTQSTGATASSIMHTRDICVIVLNAIILVCATFGIAGMYGTGIVWATVSSDDFEVKFGLLKQFSAQSGWVSYQSCVDSLSADTSNNLYRMCENCNIYGKVALGCCAVVALLSVIGLVQLIRGAKSHRVTMTMAGLFSLFATGSFSACYVRIFLLYDDQYDNNHDPTLHVGAISMVLALILSWMACCCHRRPAPELTIVSQEIYSDPLIYTSVTATPPPPTTTTTYESAPVYQQVAPPAPAPPVPQKSTNWQQFTNSEGQAYYFNPTTQESTWSPPSDQ